VYREAEKWKARVEEFEKVQARSAGVGDTLMAEVRERGKKEGRRGTNGVSFSLWQVESCLASFRSLKKLVQKRIEGQNPNLSLILGMETEEDTKQQEAFDANVSVTEKISSIKKEIVDLQNMIVAHYAESVGDQCAMQ
jgi:hypothetical protein